QSDAGTETRRPAAERLPPGRVVPEAAKSRQPASPARCHPDAQVNGFVASRPAARERDVEALAATLPRAAQEIEHRFGCICWLDVRDASGLREAVGEHPASPADVVDEPVLVHRAARDRAADEASRHAEAARLSGAQ